MESMLLVCIWLSKGHLGPSNEAAARVITETNTQYVWRTCIFFFGKQCKFTIPYHFKMYSCSTNTLYTAHCWGYWKVVCFSYQQLYPTWKYCSCHLSTFKYSVHLHNRLLSHRLPAKPWRKLFVQHCTNSYRKSVNWPLMDLIVILDK